MKVGIIIVTYDLDKSLARTLDALYASAYHVLVVDNAHKKSTESLVESYGYGYLGFNNGGVQYAGAVGAGMRYYFWRRGVEVDAVLVLTNDVVVYPSAISEMVVAMQADPEIGIVGARVLRHDNNTVWCRGGANVVMGLPVLLGGEGDKWKPVIPVEQVDIVVGCTMLVRMKMIAEIGGVVEALGCYFEDAEYSYRARRCGWKVVSANLAVTYHEIGTTMAKNPQMQWHYFVRNWLWWMKWYRMPIRFVWLLIFPLAVVYLSITGKWGAARGMLYGWRDYLKNRIGLLKY